MEIETKPLSDLKPAPYNPRITLQPGMPQFEKLRRSLDTFSLVQPIVWNRRTGHVVGGHQRLEVLRHQGRTEVQCVVVDLPPDEEKALNITLNNDRVAGDWDPARLVDVLSELSASSDFDATLTGFDDADLKDLLLAPEHSPPVAPRSTQDAPDADVQVTLHIPPEEWEDVRSWIDALLDAHPTLRLHVRMPC